MMTKIEYIKVSHRVTNQKLREWLRLRGKGVPKYIWICLSYTTIGVVYMISWLAFVATLFKDVEYTLHYMECEIAELPKDKIQSYIEERYSKFTRRLSYGNIKRKEKERIEKVFEYLYIKYPKPQPNITNPDSEIVDHISQVKSTVNEIADFHKQQKIEREQAKQLDEEEFYQAKQRQQRTINSGTFSLTPTDFECKLVDEQLIILVDYMNTLKLFKSKITVDELRTIMQCRHKEPICTTHNKVLALLFESLSAKYFITPKWQRVAATNECFASKEGKTLTSKDLSAAKSQAHLIDINKMRMIQDCINTLRQ